MLHPGDQTRDQPQPRAGLRQGRHRLEPQSREAHPATRKPARRPGPDPDAGAALLEQTARPPARVHGLLRQHSEPGRLSGPDAGRLQPEDVRESRTARLVEQPRRQRRTRSWRNCAPPASIWATRSSSPASPAPDGKAAGAGLLRRSEARPASPSSSSSSMCRPTSRSKSATAWWPSAPRDAVAAFAASLDAPAGGFQNTPFYARINESYKNGAGLLLSADLAGTRAASGRLPAARATSSPKRRRSTTRWKLAPRSASTDPAPGSPPGSPTPLRWARSTTSRPRPPS